MIIISVFQQEEEEEEEEEPTVFSGAFLKCFCFFFNAFQLAPSFGQ